LVPVVTTDETTRVEVLARMRESVESMTSGPAIVFVTPAPPYEMTAAG